MKWQRYACCAVGLLALIVTSACFVGLEGRTPVVVHKPGPPPHAPAHGLRRKYSYRYYPNVFVYFDVERKLYFYLHDGDWKVTVDLPAHIHIDAGEAVLLTLETDTPYVEFEAHKAKYPPGLAKKHGRPEEGAGKGRGKGP